MSLFEIHTRLANEKLKTEDIDGALAEYRAALAVQEDHQQILDQVIRIYLNKKDFHNARSYLEQALSYHPQNERFISRMGVVCFLLRDFKTAKVWLEKAVANNPQDKNLQDLLKQTQMMNVK
jgi:tetratricopeptide (TPR) repeat protein